MEGPSPGVTTVAVLGHVDHGKSTLVGRLLFETGQVPADRVEFARRRSRERGRELEFAFLLDGLAEEQEEGITIDFTLVPLEAGGRSFVMADSPGHREFLHNMLSGASRADAALLVIDAAEGVREQTRRHAFLLGMLGVRQAALVVNKMDRMGWSEEAFRTVSLAAAETLRPLGIRFRAAVPASARGGDNLARPSPNLPWHAGPTVLEVLQEFTPRKTEGEGLRFPVQDLYLSGGCRLLAGRVESGRMEEGLPVTLWPSGRTSSVKGLHAWPRWDGGAAEPGTCLAVELADPLPAERGTLLSGVDVKPAVASAFHAHLVWLGREPAREGDRFRLRLGIQEAIARFRRIEQVIDPAAMEEAGTRDRIPPGSVARVLLAADRPLVLEPFAVSPCNGRFILADGFQVVGGGTVLAIPPLEEAAAGSGPPDPGSPRSCPVSPGEREAPDRPPAMTIWFTGLSGSGKSTLARLLEGRLVRSGIPAFVLDGDDLRRGINRDLGFSRFDRRENIRRAAEAARLLNRAGVAAVAAFISPYAEDRLAARALFPPGLFREVYLRCPLEICKARDVKGLYRRAREGGIARLTGIDDVYEPPVSPDLVIDTSTELPGESLERIVRWLSGAGLLPAG